MKTPEEIKKALECCSRQWESNPCDGCPYDECGCGRAGKENFPLDVLTYVKALEAAQPKWISVKDRMPEAYQHVIVHVQHTPKYRGDTPKEECWHVVGEDCWCGDGWDVNADSDVHEVTHWMPLPEPPKEEVRENA